MKAIEFAERYYDGSQLDTEQDRSGVPGAFDVDRFYSALVLETLGVSDDNTSRVLGAHEDSRTITRLLSPSSTLSYTRDYLNGLAYESPENGGLGNPTFLMLSQLMIVMSGEIFDQLKNDGEVTEKITDEGFSVATDFLRISGASAMALRDRIIKQRFERDWESYVLKSRDRKNPPETRVARRLEGAINEYDTVLTLIAIARHSGFVVFPAPSMFDRAKSAEQKPDFIMYNPQKKTAVGVQTKLNPSEDKALMYKDPENGVMLISGRYDLGNSRRRKTYNPKSPELSFAGSIVDGFNRFYFSHTFHRLEGVIRQFDKATASYMKMRYSVGSGNKETAKVKSAFERKREFLTERLEQTFGL